MIQCNSEKDCSTGNLCVNQVCSPLNAANVAAKIPIWGWVVIGVSVLLIILLTVRCCCWPTRKGSNLKDKLQDRNGPAPLPKNYQKPVDLLEVADANKKAENAITRQKPAPIQPRAAQIRKAPNDGMVIPSSSVSQSEILYQDGAQYSQYGFQSYNQQGYPSNQGYYGNTAAQYPMPDQVHYSPNQNINNKLHKYEEYDYSYHPYC